MNKDAEFDEFLRARGDRLFQYAYLLTGNRPDAEDLLQNALVRVYLRWDRIKDSGSIERYTRATITTQHVSAWRRWGRKVDVVEEVAPSGGAYEQPSWTSTINDRDLIWRHLHVLSNQQRAVLVLRFYEDMTEPAIAEALGCSVGTVKGYLSRGLARLREAILAGEATQARKEGASRE